MIILSVISAPTQFSNHSTYDYYCSFYLAYRKSLKTANIFREIGKAAQVQKNMKEALKYYNLAVAFTPYKPHPHPNEFLDEEYSKDFIETVLERSAILLKVRGGEEALRDANFLLGLLGMGMWISECLSN
jgi:hypothetical protein